jgi:uncharacterized cupin superfamily protein
MITKREAVLVSATALIMCIPMAIIAHRNEPQRMPSSAIEWNDVQATKSKTGEKRQFCNAPTATLENLEIHASTLNPGESAHPPHQHPEEELTVVKEGTVEVLVNGALKRVGPGSIIFQSANDMHSIKNVGTTPAIYHAIKWRTAKTGPAK